MDLFINEMTSILVCFLGSGAFCFQIPSSPTHWYIPTSWPEHNFEFKVW